MTASYSAAQQTSQSLDPVFNKRMEDLRVGLEKAGTLMQSASSWKWLPLYTDKPNSSESDTDRKDGKVLNGFSHSEFVTAFDRTALNKKYIDAAQPKEGSAPSYRDAQTLKVQLDLLAGIERDLRMRYRSRVRMLAHGVARVQSHGLTVGPITNGIVNFLKLLADRK